jgi:hypothetical protein
MRYENGVHFTLILRYFSISAQLEAKLGPSKSEWRGLIKPGG